jgi:alkylated DNA repair dioxygenase AlkB
MGEFNQILLNWYSDGLHYIGPHSDDERQLVTESPVLSVTRGAARKFRLRQKKVKGILKDVLMPDGTVLVMGGKFQKELTHDVPKVGGAKGAAVGRRINVTLRQFSE